MTRESFLLDWERIVSSVSKTFGFSAEIREKIFNNESAKLIALIPFLSGAPLPFRAACSGLAIYYLSIGEGTKQFFTHTELDNGFVLTRLKNLMLYSGGDEKIQVAGIALLALHMVHDYERDKEVDVKLGKYNPIGMKVWDFHSVKQELYALFMPEEPIFSPFIAVETYLNTYWED